MEGGLSTRLKSWTHYQCTAYLHLQLLIAMHGSCTTSVYSKHNPSMSQHKLHPLHDITLCHSLHYMHNVIIQTVLRFHAHLLGLITTTTSCVYKHPYKNRHPHEKVPLPCKCSLVPRPAPSFLSLAVRLSGRGPGTFPHVSDVTDRANYANVGVM